MNKRLKNRVLAGVITLGLAAMVSVGCNKYDKMNILGEWVIDLKAAKGLKGEYVKESLHFKSGVGQLYTETYDARDGSRDTWTIDGKFERKNNKITFSNRNHDKSGKMPDVTYKYRIEDDKLILIVKDEGFKNDEKIYTRKKTE